MYQQIEKSVRSLLFPGETKEPAKEEQKPQKATSPES
jgi:hypothetical protein